MLANKARRRLRAKFDVALVASPAASVTAGQTTHTFTGVSFGATSSRRRIIVAVGVGDGTSRSITSATIGGVAATIHATVSAAGKTSAIISAMVPSGTSGNVVINLSGAAKTVAVQIYRGIACTVSSTSYNSGYTSTQTMSLNTTSAGFTIGQITAYHGFSQPTLANSAGYDALTSVADTPNYGVIGSGLDFPCSTASPKTYSTTTSVQCYCAETIAHFVKG